MDCTEQGYLPVERGLRERLEWSGMLEAGDARCVWENGSGGSFAAVKF